MGKAKRRSINLGKHNQFQNITRDEAIELVIDKLLKNEKVDDLISLFGLKADELLEAGADYESVISLGGQVQ